MARIVTGLVFLIVLFWAVAAVAESVGEVPLTSLDLSKMRQGWGYPHIDKAVTDVPMSIGGRKFDRGLGTHAPSILWIDLKGQAARFEAWVGVDDKVEQGKGTIVFKVVGDNKKLYQSPVMKAGDAPQRVDVPLKGIKTLVLLVGDAEDWMDHDHADWAEARFTGTTTPPLATDPPREKAEILTPKPSPKPRINGPKVFGVRPGHPVIFTVPATGDRPMVFAAAGLPSGLSLNVKTGHITGSVAKPGTYTVSLTASNALGEAKRDLKIVVGDVLALTPPMGWNHWYTFWDRVTEKDIRAAADAMVATGMIDHGYSYVNIDDCWMVRVGSNDPETGGDARDAQGNIRPNKRFGDMKALTDYIHSKGLRAGLYTSPGPLTCAKFAGSYGYEEQDAKQFADWGFDFLKYDFCSYSSVWKGDSLEEHKRPYKLMGDLLKKQDRDIVFNLCQYGWANVWEWGREVGGNCSRTATDIGANPSAYSIGFTQNGLEKWAGPGHWNDPDYINIGYLGSPTVLTPNEQYTYVTLWSLLAAPLFFSGDITKLDDFTLSLLTNDEVIEVNQDPLGRQARRVSRDGDMEVWAKDMEDGSKAVGLFNRSEFSAKVTAKWSNLGIKGTHKARDLWRQRDIGRFRDNLSQEVPRHGTVMLRLWPQ